MENEQASRIGRKNWFNVIFFGFIGQLAWIVENMYFSTFAQNIFDDTAKFGNAYYLATTLMVIFSALTATVTTIFAGAMCDRLGKRKPLITIGYLLWGFTIMLFAVIPMDFSSTQTGLIITLLVVFDCIMTVAGSTANDAAFNTWITDISDVTNRGKLNTILSMMPVFATVVVLGIAMFTFDKGNYKLFFILLGIAPILSSVISYFTLKDKKVSIKSTDSFLKDTFYGFKGSVIKSNKLMYVCLSALCLAGISQQVYMSYLINFVAKTLGITNYIIPVGVVIVLSAVITGVMGILYDKFGRKNFYIPITGTLIVGTLGVYLIKFFPQTAYLPLIIIMGTVMLGSMLALSGGLMSSFQDYIPKGYEGRFQGIRMCFTVLVPMIIGPIISLAIGINSFDLKDSVATTSPPYEIFLASAIVALLVIIPIVFVRKDADRLRLTLLNEKREEREENNDTDN